MKKRYLIPILLLLGGKALGQNQEIKINLASGSLNIEKIDVSRPIHFLIEDCQEKQALIFKINPKESGKKAYQKTVNCKDGLILSPGDEIGQNLSSDVQIWNSRGSQTLMLIAIDGDGNIKTDPKTTGAQPVNPNIPVRGNNAPSSPGSAIVSYDACGNLVSIVDDGRQSEKIRYTGKRKGVTFIIKNINVLKYEVTLSSSYERRFTEKPDLFNTVVGLIAPGAKLLNASKDMANELQLYLDIHDQLKKILDSKCRDFEHDKIMMRTTIENAFKFNGVFVTIDKRYNSLRESLITTDQQKNKDYNLEYLNKDLQQTYHLSTPPDDLVAETIKMYNLLIATDFSYESKIIELENADDLVFSLSMTAKKDVPIGNLVINSSSFSVPISHGWKIDFSSGFYYSNIRNESYGLREKALNDSTSKKEIIAEGNLRDGALGVAAMMHFYPKISKSFNPALTLGLGTSLNINYSVLLGASVLLGRYNRVGISGGVNFSNIKMLAKSQLDDSEKPLLLPMATTEVNYYSRFKTGYFLSFSYSLGLGPAKQAAAKAGE